MEGWVEVEGLIDPFDVGKLGVLVDLTFDG
jgi:hypothetical protein